MLFPKIAAAATVLAIIVLTDYAKANEVSPVATSESGSPGMDEPMTEVIVETVPNISQSDRVFVCANRASLDDIILGGLYADQELNAVCGMVYAIEFTFIGEAQDAYAILNGEEDENGQQIGVGIYEVQACNRTYTIAWPYTPEKHFTNPELASDVGLSQFLIRDGYPVGTCVYESLREEVVAISTKEADVQ